MSTNCLVTKLKSVVENDNLDKLNVFVIDVVKQEQIGNNDNKLILTTRASKTLHLKVVGNGYFSTNPNNIETDHLTEIDITSTSGLALYFLNENYKIEVSSIYDIDIINTEGSAYGSIFKLNISKLNYSGVKILINNNGGTCGTLKDLKKWTELESFIITADSPIIGNLSDIDGASFPIQVFNLRYNRAVVGDFACLGQFASLVTIGIPLSCSGSVESFVANKISAGVSQGEVTAYNIASSNVTFGGLTNYDNYKVYNKIHWDSNSKMYVTNSAFTDIVAKGYSQEEIAAWEQAGKTVVVVS